MLAYMSNTCARFMSASSPAATAADSHRLHNTFARYCCDLFYKVVAVEQHARACIVLVSPCQKNKSHVARAQLISLHRFRTRPFFIRPQTLGAAALAVEEEDCTEFAREADYETK